MGGNNALSKTKTGLDDARAHSRGNKGHAKSGSHLRLRARGKLGVDLNEVHRAKHAGVGDRLGDVVGLAKVKTTTHEGAGGRSDLGIDSIDIVAQVKRAELTVGLAQRVDGHFHDVADAVAVDVVHREGSDVLLTDDLALLRVKVAETNEDDLLRAELGHVLEPLKAGEQSGVHESEQESERHAMHVTAGAGLRSVEVSVGVDPDDTGVGAGTKNGRHGACRDGVVTAEDECKLLLRGRLKDLVVDFLEALSYSVAVLGETLDLLGVDGRVVARGLVELEVSLVINAPLQTEKVVFEATGSQDLRSLISACAGLTPGHGGANDAGGLGHTEEGGNFNFVTKVVIASVNDSATKALLLSDEALASGLSGAPPPHGGLL